MRNLNEMAARVHKANAKWWHDLNTGERLDRNKGEMLMPMVSEIAEAMEGERKDLMDDHLPHRKMAEVEMADLVIRALDYAGGHGYELLATRKYRVSLPENRGEALLTLVHLVFVVRAYEQHGGYQTPDQLMMLVTGAEEYCAKFGYDLWGAVDEKFAYNATRADHQHEARRAANGKKW